MAKLGPLAASAILINLKDGFYGGKNMFIRANGGVAIPPSNVKMTNAANEHAFRMQFAELLCKQVLNVLPIWRKCLHG